MTSKTDAITREYFDSMLITPMYLDSDLPDISMEMFGYNFKTPVMTAALSQQLATELDPDMPMIIEHLKSDTEYEKSTQYVLDAYNHR